VNVIDNSDNILIQISCFLYFFFNFTDFCYDWDVWKYIYTKNICLSGVVATHIIMQYYLILLFLNYCNWRRRKIRNGNLQDDVKLCIYFKYTATTRVYININHKWNPQSNCVVLCNKGGQVLGVLWRNWEIRIVNNIHSLNGLIIYCCSSFFLPKLRR
jgi:hypothetical protein